jgi:hypothetical protein
MTTQRWQRIQINKPQRDRDTEDGSRGLRGLRNSIARRTPRGGGPAAPADVRRAPSLCLCVSVANVLYRLGDRRAL